MPDKDGNTICPRCNNTVPAHDLVGVQIGSGHLWIVCLTNCVPEIENFMDVGL